MDVEELKIKNYRIQFNSVVLFYLSVWWVGFYLCVFWILIRFSRCSNRTRNWNEIRIWEQKICQQVYGNEIY